MAFGGCRGSVLKVSCSFGLGARCRYHTWLRALPLQDGEAAEASGDGAAQGANDTPSSTSLRGRLHLLEWSVLMQRDELARSKRLFVRDITDLQVRVASCAW